MAITARNVLKQYLETGKKPTQSQFANLIDSFLHKSDDTITIADVGGLSSVLANKASNVQIVAILAAIGELEDLETSDKSSLVGAINELKDLIGSIGGASSFADLGGSPDDNPALAGKFTAIENEIDDEANARTAADDAYLLLAKAYADLVATDVRRYAGEWDASTGVYPSTNGTGGAIRRGDCFEISVAGTIYGQEFEAGDEIRAKIAAPGQTPSNWGSGQVNSQQATTTKVGIARMATNAEALAALNSLLMSNPVTVYSQILGEKKNYIKECYVLSVMEIIFPMELAGQFTALSCSTAMSNLQYKIGAAGTYTTFSTPVSYSAGAEIYLKWDYTSPTEQRGWLRMKGKDS